MENNEDSKIVNNNTNCNVFTAPVYGASFPLPGSNVTINQYYGKGQKPKEELKEGEVETKEQRDKRKAEALKAITDRFNFEDSQLGYDNKRKRITNDRLAGLFRKCLGFGYIPPSSDKRLIIEQLWVLLIDKRNRCPKHPGEGYIRQTVLNMIGYFVKRELIFGTQKEIATALFKDASDGITKHIPRAFDNCPDYPEGTEALFDYYIDQLKNGE